jgi:hypothetical protein
MARMLSERDDVIEKKAFGVPAFFVSGRMFAAVTRDGIILKLPAERMATLLETRSEEVGPFRGNGRTMGGWVQIALEDAEAFAAERELIDEAREYVAQLAMQSDGR